MNAQNPATPFGEIGNRRGALPPRILLFISATVVLTSLTVSLTVAGREDAVLMTSWATCVLCALMMFTTSSKMSHAIIKTVALGVTLSLFSHPVIPALAFGGVISIGAYSSLVGSAKKGRVWLPLVLPVASYVAALALTLDPLLSLGAIVIYVPALFMGISTGLRASMTTTVVFGAAGLFIIVAGAAALGLYVYYGSVSISAAEAFTKDLTDSAIYYYGLSFDMMAEEGYEITEELRDVLMLSVEETIQQCVSAVAGIAIAICACVSYAAVTFQQKIFAAYEIDERLSPEETTFTLSVTAALVFAVAFILTFSVDSFNRVSIVAVVSSNLCIALTPALSLMAFRAIKAFPRRLGLKGLLLSIALIGITVFLFSSFPVILPIVGAIYVVVNAVDTWAKDFYAKGDKK